ncbi:Major Facilitator Superfamily (MFS), partial [Thraustotheca clavata]
LIEMVLQTIIPCLIGVFVAGGALLDTEGSRESNQLHPRFYRWLRFSNWFPLGIAYAAFYMARYNIAAGNIASIRASLNTTSTDMGWVISSGSWAYALSAPFTGHITDRIGGQRGMALACIGAGICNLLLGVIFSLRTFTLAEFMLLFALNQTFQGFGTAAVVKINAMWYAPSERGIFSGIFNMLVVSGYYLALGSGGSIVEHLGWPFLFYIPSIMLFSIGVMALVWIKNAPPTKYKHPSLPTMPVTRPLCHENGNSGFVRLLCNPTVWGYLGAIACLSWARDGLLNWMYSYFDAVRPTPLTTRDRSLLGGAWTLGGFVGGILCGWVSDRVFQSKRMPPIVLFAVLQAILVYTLYDLGSRVSVESLAGLLFFASVFLLGSYTMLSYTIPTDLPVDIAASAGGLFTTAAYLATGLSGAAMGCLIQRWGYSIWVMSLLVASLASGVCTMLGSYLARFHANSFEETIPIKSSGYSSSRSRRASLINTQADFFAVENDEEYDIQESVIMARTQLPQLPDQLDFTKENIERILTFGTWCYAIFAPIVGHITDRIGGYRISLVACVGIGICHLALALHFHVSYTSKGSFMFVYIMSRILEGFIAASLCKINAKWYTQKERGVFAGVLSSTILAGSDIVVELVNLQNLLQNWCQIFLLSSGSLFALAFVCLEVLKDKPLKARQQSQRCYFKRTATLGEALCHKPLLGYIVIMVCLSYVMTTLIDDFYYFTSEAHHQKLKASDRALLRLSWLLGGVVGGILCGLQNDLVHEAQRPYTIGLLCCYQTVVVCALLFISQVWLIDTIVMFIIFSSAVVMGILSLLTWAISMEMPFEMTSSAIGLLITAKYIGIGLSEATLGQYRSSISFVTWVFIIVIITIVAALVSFWIHIFMVESPRKMTERIPLYRLRQDHEDPMSMRRASL